MPSTFPEKTLVSLLRPIVRLCLRRGLKIQEILETLKKTFLMVTEEDLIKQDSTVNISKLAVATGLHRRDVMRLWRDESPSKTSSNLLVRIVGQWQKDYKFSKKGKPNVLSCESEDSEFAFLVRSVTQDLSPYTVLFELERAGMIERIPTGIRLKAPVYRPSGDVNQGLEMLASDIEDLTRAVEYNVHGSPDILNLHVKTEYDNIPTTYLPELKKWVLEQGMEFHKKMREKISRYDRDMNKRLKGDGLGRIAVGTFSFCDDLMTSAKGKTIKITSGKMKRSGK